MHSDFLRIWDFPNRVIFCSSCILMLPRIFGVYFSIPFFTNPRTPITTGTAVGFHSSKLIHSILISRSFFDYFSEVSFGMVKWMSRQLFSFFVYEDDVWSVGPYLKNLSALTCPIRLWRISFCYCLGLVLVLFFFCIDVTFYRIFQCRYVASLLCLYRY